jgi:signal peptidase I
MAVYVYSAVLFVCIGIQCFFTIDPLTRLAFQTRSAGNTTICYVGRNKDIKNMYYGDYMVYNTQYTYLDRVQTQILAEVGYNPDTMDIIQPDINDSFVAGNVPLYYLNWDVQKKKRVFYQNEDTIEMYGPYVASDIVNGKVKRKDLESTAVYISIPYWLQVDAQEELQSLSQDYDIGEKQTLKTFQGSIDYYVLTLKEK